MMQIVRGGRIFCSKFCTAPFSISTSRTGFSEGRNGVWGSSVSRRGRSYAASLPSETPKPQKARRRLSVAERRAMIVSFVSKYRSANAGKFPTTSITVKEVGGSYYVVRRILQELEYISNKQPLQPNYLAEKKTLCEGVVKLQTPDGQSDFVSEESNIRSLEKPEEPKIGSNQGRSSDIFVTESSSVEEKLGKVSDQHLEVPEDGKTEKTQDVQADIGALKSHLLKEQTEIGNAVDDKKEQNRGKGIEKPEDYIMEDTQGSNSNISATERRLHEGKIREVSDQHLEVPKDGKTEKTQDAQADIGSLKSHLLKESTEIRNAVNEKEERTVSQNLVNHDVSEVKDEQYQQTPDHAKRAIEQTQDEERKKSTLWGNLKSFADSIVNTWRKL